MTGFNVMEKQQKSRFLTSGFYWDHQFIAKPKVNIHSKIQSLSQPRSDFFLLIHFLGRATAVCSRASWPCLNFQHHNCMHCMLRELHARIFDSVRFFPPLFFIFVLVLVHSHSNLPWKFCACCDNFFSCSPGLAYSTFFARWSPLSMVTPESLNPVDCLQFLYTENHLKL